MSRILLFAVTLCASAFSLVAGHTLSCSDMKSLVSEFFVKEHRDIMLCIAFHESSYDPSARNPSGATGLFQIMPSHCGEPGCPDKAHCIEHLEDPTKNAKCAKSVLHSQGFEAWTTYSMCRKGGGSCQIHSEIEYLPNPFGRPDYIHHVAKDLILKEFGKGGNITRDEVLKCAKRWVADQIPYCQCNGANECCGDCPHCSTYRCDCAGYIAACYKLAHSYDTATLPEVFHRIEHHELKKGDIMLWTGNPPEGHVVMFGAWHDESTLGKTKYHAYQEPGCHEDGPHHAYESVVPYPMSWTPPYGAFEPYRYNHIVD